MSSFSNAYHDDPWLPMDPDYRYEQGRSHYSENKSELSVVILHMAELLNSYVRGDTVQQRAHYAAQLAEVREAIGDGDVDSELQMLNSFSVMLEEGLQFLDTKCTIMENALSKTVQVHQSDQTSSNRGEKRKREGKEELEGKKKPTPHDQSVACDLCSCSVPRLRYAAHLKRVHPDEFSKIAKFRCEHCEKAVFLREKAYNVHLQTCPVRVEAERIQRRLPMDGNLMCQLCESVFSTMDELSGHAEKEHPTCRILACTGCGITFSKTSEVVDHWKEAGKQYAYTRCARDAYAVLVTKQKLVAQILRAAKKDGGVKNSAYLECMTQPLACPECGVIVTGYVPLYQHMHQKHNKVAKSSLSFGCVGCGNTYRCPPSLREHLLRMEIERRESCKNAGVVYWNGEEMAGWGGERR